MNERIGKEEIAQMFVQAAKNLRGQHARLSELDSVAGDGDHGTTMLRVAEQLESAINPTSPKNLRSILRETGWNVLGVDGGASSAILGTFFAGMADAAMGEDSMDCHELAEAFQFGLDAVSRRTKAQPGDKTMMDALVPAVAALHSPRRLCKQNHTGSFTRDRLGGAVGSGIDKGFGCSIRPVQISG